MARLSMLRAAARMIRQAREPGFGGGNLGGRREVTGPLPLHQGEHPGEAQHETGNQLPA